VLGCVFKSKEKRVWIVLQMEVIFLGYWKKRLYIQMILTFDKIVFTQVQWYFNFFEIIMVGDWYFLCFT
jgi:hypothetical protein